MSTFKNKNSLRTIEAQIVQKLKKMRLGQNLLVLKKKACILMTLIGEYFWNHVVNHGKPLSLF